MEAFQLKNKELQKKLDDLSDGAFSEELKNNYQYYLSKLKEAMLKDEISGYTLVFFGPKCDGTSQFSAKIPNEIFETVSVFIPDEWNEWPAVEPPKDVLMRVESYIRSYYDGPEIYPEKVMDRFCAYWNGCKWEKDGRVFDPVCNLRFRPWDN